MDRLYEIFPLLVGAGITGEKVNKEKLSGLTPELFSRLYKLSKEHGVNQLVYSALVNAGVKTEDYLEMKDLAKLGLFSAVKAEKLLYEEQTIFDLFEKEGVNYLVMKGTVLRGLYPSIDMRLSCDIDIVLDKGDKRRVFNLLEENGYKRVKDYQEEITYLSSGNQSIELHFDITEGDKTLTALFDGFMQRAVKLDGLKHGFKLCAEDFVAYHISHMAKHLKSGGCGIKSVADFLVIDKELQFDKTALKNKLESVNLNKFYIELINLKEFWFGSSKPSETTKSLARFIIDGGAYGNDDMQNQIKKTRQGKLKYALSRLFMPYSKLKTTYPVIVKHKVLYPFCLIHRIFKKAFGKKTTNFETNETFNAKKASELLEELGL